MQFLALAVFVTAPIATANFSSAPILHGGVYRGPGDTVPPGAQPQNPPSAPPTGPTGGPAPTGPKGPKTPPPGVGPDLPGPRRAGGGARGPSTGEYTRDGADLAAWSFWWEFNKAPYLDLRAVVRSGLTETGSRDFFLGDGGEEGRVDSLAPTVEQIRDSIVPALLKALEGESNNDIVTGCLMALAKIGESRDGSESLGLADTIAAYLSDPNQEIAETAAVALGVLGGSDDSCLGRLISIATDSSDGRTLCGAPQSPVAQRTRTFAAYGLGLVGARLTGEEHLATRQRIVDVLARGLLPAERESTQDLAAAMVISMGLVPLPPSGDAEVWEPCTIEEVLDAERGVSTLEQQLSLLLAVFDDQRLDRYLRAHVPTALARLVAQMLEDEDVASLRRSSIKEVVVETLLVPLDPRKGAGFEEEVRQSCALALGIVVDSDIDPIDRRAREVLLDVHAHQQRQTKAFGLVALGKIAGREGERVEGRTDDDRFGLARAQIVEHLESRLSRGRSGEEHYAALGIGVLGYELRGTPYRLRGAELLPIRQRLEAEDAASDIGAFAIACGIGGDVGASKALVECIERVDDPTAKGYVALALGILRERGARDVLSDIVLQSEYRPELLRQASIALGLLQDKAAVEMLVDMLGRAESQSSLASLAMALGYVGDTSAVEPLVRLLGDETVTKTARGFAAAALGLVAEKDRLPWNATIAIDLNYRATVPTLNSTDGKGLLNIL